MFSPKLFFIVLQQQLFLYMRTQIMYLTTSVFPLLNGGYPISMQNPLNIYPLQRDTSVVQLFTLYLDGWIAQGKDEWGDGWRDKGAKVVNNSSPSLCDTRSQQVYRQRGEWEDKWMDVEGIKGTMREEGFQNVGLETWRGREYSVSECKISPEQHLETYSSMCQQIM